MNEAAGQHGGYSEVLTLWRDDGMLGVKMAGETTEVQAIHVRFIHPERDTDETSSE